MLLEPSRTNLFKYSEYFDNGTYNLVGGFAIETTLINSPEGVQNVSLFTSANATSEQYLNANSLTAVNGSDYILSVFAKKQDFDFIQLKFTGAGGRFSAAGVWFNISTGTVGTQSSGVSGSIEDYGNGWYRCSATATATGDGNAVTRVQLASADNTDAVTGDGAKGTYFYGGQFEQGSYPTSYIPNHSGGSVTREEDTTDEKTLSTHGSSNTWFFELKRITDLSLQNQSIAILKNDSTGANNRFTIYSTNNGRFRVLLSDEGGTTENLFSPNNSFDKGETIKVALKITSSGCTLFVDGSSVATSSSVGTITGIDAITYFRKAALKQFLIFPTALSDAECITLTS